MADLADQTPVMRQRTEMQSQVTIEHKSYAMNSLMLLFKVLRGIEIATDKLI